jgi:hypothetical protein
MVVAALALSLWTAGAPTHGVGPVVDDVRLLTVGPSALLVAGAVRVRVVAATIASPRAIVQAEENLQPAVIVRERAGVLEISTVGDVVSVGGIEVRVEVPPPSSVTVHGAARVETPLAGRARVESSGVTQLVLSGKPEQLVVVARGASSVMASEVRTPAVEVDVGGAATVEVGPTSSLRVRGTGVAKVRYRGTPTLEQSTSPTVRVTRVTP